jgi:histidine triad (HIT) family protein
MDDCIFCKIGNGEVRAAVVARDEGVIAIEDLNPQAPAHVLVMPIAHHANIVDVVRNAPALAERLMALASKLGAARGGERGFRLVINTGSEGGQTVDHVHVHVLAGRPMTWPPG